MGLQLAIEREWGREPGWLLTLGVDEQAQVIADHMHRHKLELRGVRRKGASGA